MSNDQFVSELTYQISLSIAEVLCKSGLLTDKEFSHTKALLLKKYNPPLGVLFAETS
jgi:hypothetical protein